MMAHVFDPKTVLLAKHAQHIVMIHFPIALFFVSGVFDAMAHRNKSDSLRSAGYYNLVAASISSVLAVATGIAAWQIMFGGKSPKGILLFHLLGAATAFILLWTLVFIRRREREQQRPTLSRTYVGLAVITCIVIIATAHLGGVLSGVVTLAE
jgi:uncharacterized membrane protein